MRLLAIDTALEACSVAVLDGEGEDMRLTAASEVLGRGHAERLMGMIGEVMAEAGTAFTALDRIVVTTGPGSFTGLRVGLAAARGIALVVGAPAVGVTTLAALAEQARSQDAATGEHPLHVVLAAQGGRGLRPVLFASGDADERTGCGNGGQGLPPGWPRAIGFSAVVPRRCSPAPTRPIRLS